MFGSGKAGEADTICTNATSYHHSVGEEETNPLLCAADGSPARFLVFGDSHSRIFHHINFETDSRGFDACCVGSATALGLKNIDSQTQCLRRFRSKLGPISEGKLPLGLNYRGVVIMMGEVDTGYGIWRRSRKYGTSIAEQMRLSASTLYKFIDEAIDAVGPRLPIVVAGVVLPVMTETQRAFHPFNIAMMLGVSFQAS